MSFGQGGDTGTSGSGQPSGAATLSATFQTASSFQAIPSGGIYYVRITQAPSDASAAAQTIHQSIRVVQPASESSSATQFLRLSFRLVQNASEASGSNQAVRQSIRLTGQTAAGTSTSFGRLRVSGYAQLIQFAGSTGASTLGHSVGSGSGSVWDDSFIKWDDPAAAWDALRSGAVWDDPTAKWDDPASVWDATGAATFVPGLRLSIRLAQAAASASNATLSSFEAGYWDGAGLWEDPTGNWDGIPLTGLRVSIRLVQNATDASSAFQTVHGVTPVRLVPSASESTASTLTLRVAIRLGQPVSDSGGAVQALRESIRLAQASGDAGSAAQALRSSIRISQTPSDGSAASQSVRQSIDLAQSPADSSTAIQAIRQSIRLPAQNASNASRAFFMLRVSGYVHLISFTSDGSDASQTLRLSIDVPQSPGAASGSSQNVRMSIRVPQNASDASGSGQNLVPSIRLTQAVPDATSASQALRLSVRLMQHPLSPSAPTQRLIAGLEVLQAAADASSAFQVLRVSIALKQNPASASASSQGSQQQLVNRLTQRPADHSDATFLPRLSIELSFVPYNVTSSNLNLHALTPHPVFPLLRRVTGTPGSGREAIYAYLQALLQNTLQLSSLKRGYPVWNQLNVNESPVGFMHVEGGRTAYRYGVPPVYQDTVTVWVGMTQPSMAMATIDQTPLLNMRDVLEKSLLSDQGDQHVSTLRGRVLSMYVIQDFYQEAQSIGSWTSFVSRIEVRYISAFNR